MRVGVFFPTKEYAPLDEMVERFRVVADQGFSSVWLPQSSGFDALTVLAVAGWQVPRVELGTSVIPTYPRHPVALAAQQPRMLELAGGVASGTITWCTGPVTLEEQVVPLVTAAAETAGRARPRVVVALPAIVTDDESDGRAKADEQLAGYGNIPVY